jgi:hypothetical protein
MKAPTIASLKKVTAGNLAALGAERLAQILVAAAETKPDLKRRLRMELAAAQGAEHLVVEIDKRLSSLETSRSKISWRQRPSFVRDLDILRALIVERLAALDQAAALDRIWAFMDVAGRVGGRVRDRDGSLAAVFERAAGDIAVLVHGVDDARVAEALTDAIVGNSSAWTDWLPAILAGAPAALTQSALRVMAERQGSFPGWALVMRQLADAAGDIDAYRASFTDDALRAPANAAVVALRLLAAGRTAEAGALLEAVGPRNAGDMWSGGKGQAADPDFDWETAWIAYLDQAGQGEAAQSARWISYERTLAAERAKAFTSRLPDFEDVEAEGRAFAYAAGHANAHKGLQLLMDWPALAEAARMIETRADDLRLSDQEGELWAAKLRARQPAAANILLRKAAVAAFRRRDYATSDRLTKEADALPL